MIALIIEFILGAFVLAVFIGLVLFFLSALPFILGFVAIIAVLFVMVWIFYKLFEIIKRVMSSNSNEKMSTQSKEYSGAESDVQYKRNADPATKPVLTNQDGRADDRKTVLMIDDDTFLLSMYGMKFSMAGFNTYTLTTANGNFIQKIIDAKPDIIVSNIIMPGRDGIEALKLAKKDEETKNIPFVILSNTESYAPEAKKFGAVDFIIKAKFIPSEVVEKITNILSKSGEAK